MAKKHFKRGKPRPGRGRFPTGPIGGSPPLTAPDDPPLHNREILLQALIDGLPDYAVYQDAEGRWLESNEVARRLFSLDNSSGLPGAYLRDWNTSNDQAWNTGKATRQEETVFLDEGAMTVFDVLRIPLFHDSGARKGMLVIGRDITQLKATLERLRYVSFYDTLTGLPNRLLFNDRLNQGIYNARRYGRLLAVMCVDVDNLRHINDTMDRHTGDLLLQEIAMRLKECLRDIDTVSRLGSGEFNILLRELSSSHRAVQVVQRIKSEMARPFVLEGKDIHVTVTIGLSLYPVNGEDAPTLMKNAETAMHTAKALGKNRYAFFTSEMNRTIHERVALESGLRKALEREELCVHYQPLIHLASGTITGMEALIRWSHPEMGFIRPDRFIPLAEETGLIESIGEWVLLQACTHALAVAEEGMPPLRVAINLSLVQINDRLLPVVRSVLDATGIAPHLVELEITESLFMQDINKVVSILNGLKEMGVSLAIDDFGTGYSSLKYLKSLPLDKLKIDQSFVRDIPHGHDDKAIVTTIIAMARSLNLTVLAEGVEKEEQRDFLSLHRCDEAQGYLFSKPVAPDELICLYRQCLASRKV